MTEKPLAMPLPLLPLLLMPLRRSALSDIWPHNSLSMASKNFSRSSIVIVSALATIYDRDKVPMPAL
jgi:hypothetical protein